MVLIYGDEQRWATISPEEMAEIDAGHRPFAQRAGSAVLASGQLEPPGTATETVYPSRRPNRVES